MVTLRPYQSEDRTWVEDTNIRFYRTAHGFDATFDHAVAEALDSIEQKITEVGNHYLVAEHETRRVGCIFLSKDAPDVGRVRLFYVDEAYRGRGLGSRMLRDVIVEARKGTIRQVRVSTFSEHPEACRLYEAFGFQAVRTVPVKAFGRDMTQIDFEFALNT